ncbi:condensation domain-containing protein [Streptomyces sp. NPDC088812]|uniref:condensation domain-containing protein n=1 Tax=Streptomyces sp. NPDC088812 TaxID=3365905 RepID=UPI0038003167
MTAYAATRSTHGELSWQQAGRLRRDVERNERVPNCRTSFVLPDDVTTDRLRSRLRTLVLREEALRITEISPADGGRAHYAPRVDLPVRHLAVGSAEELADVGTRMRHHLFDRADGPLWELAVIELPDAAGRPVRQVCAVFDHLISDARSTRLLRDELLGLGTDRLGAQYGRHSDWVAEQHRQFPFDAAGVPTTAREFWLRYLDGTPPDRATVFPFCPDPDGPLSGYVHCIRRDLPDIARLRAAAGRLKSSPFLLFLAGAVSAVGLVTGDDDVTVRVNTSGRAPGYLDTQGYFAENTPVRVRHPSLGEPRHALAATKSAWLRTLPYQPTPWDYILAVSGQADAKAIASRPAQVLVNFVPWTVPRESLALSERGFNSLVGTFQLIVSVADDGTCHLECQYDPGRFDTGGVHGFLDVLAARLAHFTADA